LNTKSNTTVITTRVQNAAELPVAVTGGGVTGVTSFPVPKKKIILRTISHLRLHC